MNKLLILGDSFADVGPRQWHRSLAWTSILEQQSGYQVVNKAMGGSGLYYAVKCFDSLEKEFDKIILVVTNPGRIHVPIVGTKKFETRQDSIDHHTQNIFYNEVWKQQLDRSNPDYMQGLKTLEAIANFYKYVYRAEEYRYYHNLMLNDLKKRRPDIILVYSMFPDYQGEVKPACLNDISDMELAHYGLTYDQINGHDVRTDIRRCHMCVENNRIMAEKAMGWLKGEPVKIDLKDFVKPDRPIDEYFPFRKEWEKRLNDPIKDFNYE